VRKMGKNKDAAIGFGVIAVIIAVIVGVVMAVLPESETTQNELEKVVSEKELEKVEPSNNIKFDPRIVRQAEQSIPTFQDAFRLVLDQCNSVESYSDYLVFASVLTIAYDDVAQGTDAMNEVLTALELLGYGEHYIVGPLIKETRQLAGVAGDCIENVQYIYGN